MYILQRYEDIQWFDFEYGLYFTSKIGFSIFSRVRSKSEDINDSISRSKQFTD